jgi:hypothetical protein
MGLQTWKNAPEGKVLKSDISVAKNYLTESEIKELEKIVSMYLDYAENQASRNVYMKMSDWIKKLDKFLDFNVLQHAGKITHELAIELANKEYNKFRVIQDRKFESDFDKVVKKITHKNKEKNKKEKK